MTIFVKKNVSITAELDDVVNKIVPREVSQNMIFFNTVNITTPLK